jgi:hypothetical protein
MVVFGIRLATEESDRRARRHRRLPRGITFGSAGLVALVVTGTAAAGLTALTGSPIPAPLRADDTVTIWPRVGASRIAAPRSPDPDGGPPWAVRVGTASGGQVCAGAGQVRAGVFGIVGQDDRFRALPEDAGGGCVSAPVPGRPIVAARAVAGDLRAIDGLPTTGTTVLFGAGGGSLRSVLVRTPDGRVRRPALTDDGVFVLAMRGLPSQTQPVVDLAWDGGRRRRIDMRQDQTVPDPQGGGPWAIEASDQRVQAVQRGEGPPPPQPPPGPACFSVRSPEGGSSGICGTTSRGAWTVRPRSAQRRGTTPLTARFAWSGPSRTIVVVRVGPGPAPDVTADGRAWPVRWAGSFGSRSRFDERDLGWVAVLPPRVDPDDVRVRDSEGRDVVVRPARRSTGKGRG